MQSFTFISLLEQSSSVEDLAQRLGAACMEQEAELKVELEDELMTEVVDGLRDHVIASDPDAWVAAVANPNELEGHLGRRFTALLEQADTYYPLDCLGILRGLCRGVLPKLYLRNEGIVPLDRGAPVPYAPRPLLKDVEKTPHQGTLDKNELLGGYGHRLFEFWRDKEPVRVTLDFTVRKQIDELTWSSKEQLPKIATIHPADCGLLRIHTITEKQFFDAEPLHWRPEEVASLLSQVSDVEIAVLPELSLPDPRALEAVLSQNAEHFPKLVVAGSAHMTDRNGSRLIRANEARIYLEGRLIACHRKCHAYEEARLGGQKLPRPLKEAITAEPKEITVLSGEYSRLAVVICADLNDSRIPQKLLAAGVNTLIVPSFTTKKGAFRGPIGDLAARCQAVAVIANAPPAEATRPFHGMAALPLPDPAEAVATFPPPPETGPGQIAVFDPNKPLLEAITWR